MLTPEQQRNLDRQKRNVRLEIDINGAMMMAYEMSRKLLELLEECENEDLHLKIDFFGIRKREEVEK